MAEMENDFMSGVFDHMFGEIDPDDE